VSNNSGFRRIDYIKITIFGFALTAMWSSLHTFVLPLRLLDFVAESQKNTYLGLLTFAGLVLAMLVQPIAGAISDHWGFSWGRRRPYILMGTALVIILLPGIGLANSFFALLAVYCLLQVSSNTAQGGLRGKGSAGDSRRAYPGAPAGQLYGPLLRRRG
jgi:MFS family permease